MAKNKPKFKIGDKVIYVGTQEDIECYSEEWGVHYGMELTIEETYDRHTYPEEDYVCSWEGIGSKIQEYGPLFLEKFLILNTKVSKILYVR